jgi:hypothetical protein
MAALPILLGEVEHLIMDPSQRYLMVLVHQHAALSDLDQPEYVLMDGPELSSIDNVQACDWLCQYRAPQRSFCARGLGCEAETSKIVRSQGCVP